jgi:response regulator RpfG family c-di-GMP phosphodiesterase
MLTSTLPHVLVVGEDADGTSSMCQSLASGRFRCTGAIGSNEAFAISKRLGVDVALLDVSGLDPEDGLMLARRLREETEDLGVVMVADSRSLEDLVDALRLGVVDYLAKPLAMGELADAVKRAVEWRSTVQSSRGAVSQHEQQMALDATRFATVLAEAGIASSLALDNFLGQLYGKNVAAFEHARRVASASVLIATNMNITEPLLGHIERAALLHDVGKLVIPKEIMRKAWPLGASEHALVRSHVRVTADAVAGIPFLAPTAEIVAATRERYDGKGYPLGLSGAAIPLGARLIAVAEAFDTLRVGPVSSETDSMHMANAELVRGAGSFFDPEVIKVWLRCLDRFETNGREAARS